MAIIAAFILVLVGGLEVIEIMKGRKERELAIDPVQLLATRFANGEIDEAEYARRLSVLRLGPPLELLE